MNTSANLLNTTKQYIDFHCITLNKWIEGKILGAFYNCRKGKFRAITL